MSLAMKSPDGQSSKGSIAIESGHPARRDPDASQRYHFERQVKAEALAAADRQCRYNRKIPATQWPIYKTTFHSIYIPARHDGLSPKDAERHANTEAITRSISAWRSERRNIMRERLRNLLKPVLLFTAGTGIGLYLFSEDIRTIIEFTF